MEADLTKSAAAIREWLLNVPQIAGGDRRGAVVGGFNRLGAPNFAYLEITGYFLTFLSFLVAEGYDSGALSGRAQNAIDWMNRKWSNGALPLTREHVSSPVADWRNNVIFSFDLAMALRGLSCAATFGLVDPRSANPVAESIGASLVRLIDADGHLNSHFVRPGGVFSGPLRWSTRRGVFQLKTAAAVLSCSALHLPTELISAAKRTFQARLDHMTGGEIENELHALLYGLEGIIIVLGKSSDLARTYFSHAVDRILRRDGALTGVELDNRPFRSDVVAQLLRTAAILFGSRHLGHPLLSGLLPALLSRLYEDGAVGFEKDWVSQPFDKNVWASMFSYQSLRFLEAVTAGRTISDQFIALVI